MDTPGPTAEPTITYIEDGKNTNLTGGYRTPASMAHYGHDGISDGQGCRPELPTATKKRCDSASDDDAPDATRARISSANRAT